MMTLMATRKNPLEGAPKSSHPTGLHYVRRNPDPERRSRSDCGVRSICLALDLDYDTVFNELLPMQNESRWTYSYGERKFCGGTPAGGLDCGVMQIYLQRRGWHYTSCRPGTKFNSENLPPRCIANQAGHFVCVRDGAVWDTWDSRGKRAKKLKGFYAPINPALWP